MREPERSGGTVIPIAAGAIGIVVGLLVQIGLSNRGQSPLVPPLSLPATLVVIGGCCSRSGSGCAAPCGTGREP